MDAKHAISTADVLGIHGLQGENMRITSESRKRSSGTRRAPWRPISSALMPIAVNSNVPTLPVHGEPRQTRHMELERLPNVVVSTHMFSVTAVRKST